MKLRNLALVFAVVGLVSSGADAVLYQGQLNTGGTLGGFDGLVPPATPPFLTGTDVFSNGATAFYCLSGAGGPGTACAVSAPLSL